MSYDIPCRYFETAGDANTNDVLSAVSRRAGQLGIRMVLVATCTGTTALLLRPANSSDIFNLQIKEIICKPAKF